MNWVKNSKLSIKVLIGLLCLSYTALLILGNPGRYPEIFFGLLLLTLIIPVAILAVIVTENSIYRTLSETKWTAILLGIGIATYTAYSNIWAGVEINRIFQISPGNLPYATTVLTIVFFFNKVMLPIALVLFYVALAFSSLWILYVLVIDFQNIKIFGRRVVYALASIFLIGTVMGGTSSIERNKEFYAIQVANYADFNKHHRCSAPMPSNLEGVVFLPSGAVLTSQKEVSNKRLSWKFQVLPCNPT